MLLVPDASVILKWVLPRNQEPGWRAARRIVEAFVREEVELALPSLWYFEAGNTLVRRFGKQHGGQLLRRLVELEMPEVPPRHGWGPIAVSLTADLGVTFSDASYLAVAALAGGVLVTADASFVRKVGQRPDLILLENLNLGG